MIKVDNIEVKYKNQLALSIDAPLLIEDGDKIGIIGSNGAGKTTFVKVLLGLTNYKGSITSSISHKDMAVHLQFNNYVNTMAIKYIIEMILNTSIDSNTTLKGLIDYFDFAKCLKKKYSQLSGGEKQRMTLIMVLFQEAKMVFFDEVTTGLDFETRQKLTDKIVDWYKDKDTAICIVSHYYEELEQLVDKILLLDEGKVMDYGYNHELFSKYCGKTVITIDNNAQNQAISEKFNLLHSPNHLIAIKALNPNEEELITTILRENDIDYRRSSNNIEIMSINCKIKYYETHSKEVSHVQ